MYLCSVHFLEVNSSLKFQSSLLFSIPVFFSSFIFSLPRWQLLCFLVTSFFFFFMWMKLEETENEGGVRNAAFRGDFLRCPSFPRCHRLDKYQVHEIWKNDTSADPLLCHLSLPPPLPVGSGDVDETAKCFRTLVFFLSPF